MRGRVAPRKTAGIVLTYWTTRAREEIIVIGAPHEADFWDPFQTGFSFRNGMEAALVTCLDNL